MEVAFQNIHQSTGDGNQSFFAVLPGECPMPERTEESGGLNMDFKNNGQLTQGAKDRRLRKPGINQLRFQCPGMTDSVPGKPAAARGGKPLDRKLCLQAILF